MVLNSRPNGRVPISEETRVRVQQAAAELGYAPNPVGAMLAQGSNYLVGVFVYRQEFPYETDDFFFPYLTGIQREASAQEYNVLLFTRHQSTQAGAYNNSMNSLLLADGSVLLGDNTDRQELRRLHQQGYPFVYIGRREVPDCQINWVTHNYQIGAAQATQHLLDMGHRRMVFVSSHPGHEPQEDKLAGCQQALRQYPDARLERWHYDEFDPLPTFVDDVHRQRITAILCDARAVFESVLRVLHEAGVSVPAEISVLSMTTAVNAQPYALRPSHVLLDQQGVGATATRVLIERIHDETDEPQQIMLPCKFVPGDTTGPPNR
jgi:DNA-binding LacI/PurR family transcriptional regulator